MAIGIRRGLLLFITIGGALAACIVASWGNSGGVAHAAATVEVHVKQGSLTDQNCGDQAITGGHFVINQITSPPSTITVLLSDGSTRVVSLSKQTQKVGQYTTTFAAGLSILDATASVPVGWTGQFVLSNYLCGSGPSSPPPSSEPPPSS